MKFLLASLLLLGCASIPEPDAVTPVSSVTDPRLRAHLKFDADGEEYTGTAMIPRRLGIGVVFRIYLPKDSRFVFVNTCAREEVFEVSDSTFEYQFNAGMYKENTGSCMLVFTVITKGGEFHRAVVDFTNNTGRDLSAEMFCNGVWGETQEGAGICQVRATLPMSVRFKSPVIYANPPECEAPKCVAGCKTINDVIVGTEFDIKTTEGFCGYDFNSKDNLSFRLTTIGYTSVLNVFPPLKGK